MNEIRKAFFDSVAVEESVASWFVKRWTNGEFANLEECLMALAIDLEARRRNMEDELRTLDGLAFQPRRIG